MTELRLPRVYTILPGINFAHALASQLWSEYQHDLAALSDVQIYLPNRRSVRAMTDMFLEVSDGQATLLPRLTPLGDIDEDELLEDDPFILQEDPFLTPAIPSLERQVLLTRLIMQRPDIPVTVTEAWLLAGDLARLIDRAHTENVALDKLNHLVEGELAAHWQKTRDFLEVITRHWPDILAAGQQSDPAQRRNLIVEKKIEALRRNPPSHRVIAAGSTGSIPSTARLLDVIARLPDGCVILPGFDPMIDDRLWDAIDEQHPYYYQKDLIKRMDIDRKSIGYWPVPGRNTARQDNEKLTLTHHALQPQAIFDLSDAMLDTEKLKGMQFIQAETPLHEAKIIALYLRDILNTPEQTAMVVTPDRILAQYIQQEMQRWGIIVNDSAGRSLEETTIGSFLKLVAGFSETTCPQTHLLSLLRHEYFRLHPPAEKRQEDIHLLETALRERFLPAGGFPAFAEKYDSLLLNDTLAILQPLCCEQDKPLHEWLSLHITAAEQLATTPTVSGSALLWRYEEGEAAAQLLRQLYEATLPHPIAMVAQDYASFIGSALSQVIVRPRYGTHPRIRILSPIEARIQQADKIILAGLNDGVWPQQAANDTWLSRPMQQEMGFGSPDRRIGQSALDFQLLFCAPDVLVTWAKKRGGVLAHPSRWLQQVFAVLKRNDALPAFDASPYAVWARQWDEPKKLAPQQAPSFSPPIEARPRKLAVTKIERLHNDPYALYAEKILKLRPLELLDRQPDPRDWGNAAHAILERFFRELGFVQPGPAAFFNRIANDVLQDYPLNTAQEKAWRGKLDAIRDWLLSSQRDDAIRILPEQGLSMTLSLADGTSFTLTGRADRMDIAGDSLVITDYKTGSVPTKKAVANGSAPQMPLLGLLARQNSAWQDRAIALQYIKLSGKTDNPASVDALKDPDALIEENLAHLHQLLEDFYLAQQPYQARMLPAGSHDNYTHLKRVAEWAALDDGDADSEDEA